MKVVTSADLAHVEHIVKLHIEQLSVNEVLR